MTDRVLDKFLGKRAGDSVREDPPADGDAADDLGCFGWLRGSRERAVMLELRKKDGTIRALPYAWLESAEFDPSDGITLRVNGRQVRIQGRNLNGEARPQIRLFEGITRHRVPWVQEADEAARFAASKQATLIDDIAW